METPPTISEALAAYSLALQARNHRPRGIERYRWVLRRFLVHLHPTHVDQRAITEQSILAYRDELALRCHPGSVNNFVTATRSFCRWAMRRNMRQDDPTLHVEWLRRPRRIPRALMQQDLRRLWKALAEQGSSPEWAWLRNRRAVFLMYFAGLRLNEAACLLWKDVDLEGDALFVEDGKGGVPRMLPMHPTLRAELELVPEAQRQPHYAVAGLKSGKPMASKSMAHIFETWLPKRGLRISAHRLRHTFATQMLRHGADIRRIQELLGHTQLATTEVYLRVDVEHMRSAVNVLPSSW
jgi:site-specific recombinase XerD